ncbi:MAG: hypothetical protein ABWZ99_10620, partial [Ilumatobacteraceae bacterium]
QSGGVSDGWLEPGHGDGEALAPVRATAPIDFAAPVGGRAGTWRARFGSPLAVAIVAGAVLAGSAGTAYAIRETLFPSIGSPTSRSVWQNPAPDTMVPATTTTAATVTTTTSPTTSTSTVTSTTPETSTTITSSAAIGPGVGAPSSSAVSGGPAVSVSPTITVEDHSGDDDSGHDDSDNSGSGSSGSGSDDSGSGSDD